MTTGVEPLQAQLDNLPEDPAGGLLSLSDQDADVFAVSDNYSSYPAYCS